MIGTHNHTQQLSGTSSSTNPPPSYGPILMHARALQGLRTWTNVIQIMERMGRDGIFEFSSDGKLNIGLLSSPLMPARLWCGLDLRLLGFEDYHVNEDRIAFQISLSLLLRTFKSAENHEQLYITIQQGSNTEQCWFNITSNHDSCLTSTIQSSAIVQQISAILISSRRAESILTESLMPTPHVQFSFSASYMRINVQLQRLQKIFDQVRILANWRGTATLRLFSQQMEIETNFSGLERPARAKKVMTEDEHRLYGVDINLAAFCKFMAAASAVNGCIDCALVENIGVVMHVDLPSIPLVTIVCYIPTNSSPI